MSSKCFHVTHETILAAASFVWFYIFNFFKTSEEDAAPRRRTSVFGAIKKKLPSRKKKYSVSKIDDSDINRKPKLQKRGSRDSGASFGTQSDLTSVESECCQLDTTQVNKAKEGQNVSTENSSVSSENPSQGGDSTSIESESLRRDISRANKLKRKRPAPIIDCDVSSGNQSDSDSTSLESESIQLDETQSNINKTVKKQPAPISDSKRDKMKE